MALIDQNDFQVLRGGVPGNYEGCHDDNFELKTGVTATFGDFIAFETASEKYIKCDLAAGTLPLMKFYCVIEGSDTYSGEFTGKVTGISGTMKLQTKQVNPTAMAVGALVSIVAGKLEVDAAKPAVGVVLAWDATSAVAVVDMF